MQIIKIDLGHEFDPFKTGSGRKFEGSFGNTSHGVAMSDPNWKPQMDIYETQTGIVIQAEMAGVDKEELEVEVNRKAVRIKGHRKPETPQEPARYNLAEIQYGRFDRILFLPTAVDPDNVHAVYKKGFLRIELTKLPLDQPHRVSIDEG